jgi:tetratricopeptide (TPR) repeat protein
MHVETGNIRAGARELREALAISEKVLPPHDLRLQQIRSGFAQTLVSAGKYDEAASVLELALTAFRQDSGGQDERTATAICNLGAVRALQGRSSEALALFREARVILEARYGADHPALVRPITGLAVASAGLGRRVEADEHFRRAADIADRWLATDHRLAGEVYSQYALFLRQCGRSTEADRMALRARQVFAASGRRNGAGVIVDAADLGE